MVPEVEKRSNLYMKRPSLSISKALPAYDRYSPGLIDPPKHEKMTG